MCIVFHSDSRPPVCLSTNAHLLSVRCTQALTVMTHTHHGTAHLNVEIKRHRVRYTGNTKAFAFSIVSFFNFFKNIFHLLHFRLSEFFLFFIFCIFAFFLPTLHKVLQNCLEQSRRCWTVHKRRREGCLSIRKAWESHQCSVAEDSRKLRTTCRVCFRTCVEL